MPKMLFILLGVVFTATADAQMPLPGYPAGDTVQAPIPQTFAPAKKIGYPVPQNYYTQHLGFFCRQELKMQQAKIPVTFRLGSMDQCNRLEQKPGYR